MTKRIINFLIASILLSSTQTQAQTKVDLGNQVRNVDFTHTDFTKPFKAGLTLPATCSANEVFLLVDGIGGFTLWICGSTNVWTQFTSGSGSTLSFSNPLVLTVSNVGSTVTCPTCLKTGATSMNANQITFTYNSATGSIDGLKITDSSGNTGTGILGHFTTATGSLMSAWQADSNGIGWKIDTTGAFQPVGQTVAGSILLKRGTGQTALGLEGSTIGTWGIIVPASFTTWNWTPPTGPCGLHQFWTTDNTGIGSCTQPAFTDISGSIATGQLPASVVLNPMTGFGDLIVSGTAGVPTRLAATAGYPHFTGSGWQFDTPSGGGGTSYDPLDTTTINSHTDFNCRDLTSSAAGTTFGIFGCGNTWSYTNKTGTVTFADTILTDDTDTNHPSDYKFTLDATSNALFQIIPVFNSNVPKTYLMRKNWDIQWVGYFSSVTNARWMIGVCSSTFGVAGTAPCNDEVFLVYDSTVSGNWGLRTGAGSAWDAQVSTGIAATTGFHKVKLSWDVSLTKVTVVIDGSTVTFCASGCTATLGSHIPAAGTGLYSTLYFGANGTGTGNYFSPVQYGMVLRGLVM